MILAPLAALVLLQTPVPLERAVPVDALFLLQARDLDALRADLRASDWVRFYHDEEMRELRGSVESLIRLAEENRKGTSFAEDLGCDPWELLRSIHGTVACFGVAQEGHSDPALAFLFEPGADRAKFDALFAKVRQKDARSRLRTTAVHTDVEIELLEERADPGEPAGELGHSAYFDVGGWTVMAGASSREALLGLVHGMIDRATGGDPAAGFAANMAAANARASASAPGRLEAFVSLSQVVREIRRTETADEETEVVLRALAVDDLRWAYVTADVGKGEALGVEMSVRLPDSGFLREWLGCLGPFPREMAAMAPRSSSSISLMGVDVWGLWQSGWKLAREIDAAAARNARAQMTDTLKQMGNLDVEKSFVSQLDGRFMSFHVAVPASEWRGTAAGAFAETNEKQSDLPATGSAVAIGLRDPAAVSGFVRGLTTALGLSGLVETEEFQGTKIHRLPAEGGGGFEWAFTKQGTAVFSQFPTAMRAALRMQTAEAKDSALENEAFAPIYAAHADASVLGLARTAETLATGLGVMQMMAPFIGMGMSQGYERAGGEGELVNPFLYLPSRALVEKHFQGTLVTTVTRRNGVLHFRLASQ